jgi:hypothetical protein
MKETKLSHNPNNTHVVVANIKHEVSSARWRYGMVAYTLKGSGNTVYSWEPSVEAI